MLPHRLDQAADDMTGEHRRAGDRHGAEPGDDALGHVHGDGDRRAWTAAATVNHDDPRHDIVRRTPPDRPTGHRARRRGSRRRRRRTAAGTRSDPRPATGQGRVARHVPQVAAQHRRGVADGVGDGGHRAVSFWLGARVVRRSSAGRPVRARKTSSRSGVWTLRASTSIAAASKLVEHGPQRADAAVARDLQRERVVVAGGAGEDAGGRGELGRSRRTAAGCGRRGPAA